MVGHSREEARLPGTLLSNAASNIAGAIADSGAAVRP